MTRLQKNLYIFLNRKVFLLWAVSISLFALFHIIGNLVLPLQIVSGLVALLLIPGFLLAQIVLPEEIFVQKLGIGLIFGCLLQMLITLAIYVPGFLFFYKQVNFQETLILLNVCIVIILFIIQPQGSVKSLGETIRYWRSSIKNMLSKKGWILLFAFLLALTLGFVYQGLIHANWVDPDSGAFLDTGRGILRGTFMPMSSEGRSWIHPYGSPDMEVAHWGASMLYAVFFVLGGVNIQSGMLMVVILGSLIIFPLYGIAKELFNEKVAYIAVFIALIQPYLLNYSAIVTGPDILGVLLLLSSLYFILLGLREKNEAPSILGAMKNNSTTICFILAGLFLFFNIITADYEFYPFLGSNISHFSNIEFQEKS